MKKYEVILSVIISEIEPSDEFVDCLGDVLADLLQGVHEVAGVEMVEILDTAELDDDN